MAPPRRAASAITSYFEAAPTNTKRKAGDDSEKENTQIIELVLNPSDDDISEVEPPKKKAKSIATKKATAAKSTTTKKATTATKAKPKAKATGPTPKKLFNDTVKLVEKQVKALDKKVKSMDGNQRSINVGTYAELATDHLKVAETLATTDPIMAFNLVLCLGDAASTDLDVAVKMCGYGEHEDPFEELDDALLPLLERRELPDGHITGVLTGVPHRWTRKDADWDYEAGWPNKQQRNQIANHRIEWEAERRQLRRERRADCDDWIAVALEDLKEERDYLDQYGVEGFFAKSIAKLEALDAARK